MQLHMYICSCIVARYVRMYIIHSYVFVNKHSEVLYILYSYADWSVKYGQMYNLHMSHCVYLHKLFAWLQYLRCQLHGYNVCWTHHYYYCQGIPQSERSPVVKLTILPPTSKQSILILLFTTSKTFSEKQYGSYCTVLYEQLSYIHSYIYINT